MSNLDTMTINEAVALYQKKREAVKAGDLSRLLKLKNKCPDLFDKDKYQALCAMLDYLEAFKKSDRYKEGALPIRN